ncbi:cytochrome P450 [Crassisporium funariophilum]|nr:cytochrome P450 [Crassisporium funariophilum]
MISPGTVLETVLKCFVVYVLIRLVHHFAFAPKPLAEIPGPPATSFWTGVLSQLFSIHGWAFHREISEKYGGVVKIKGVLGSDHLYVYDSKAVHHILVKDQYIYEESPGFIESNKLMVGKGILSSLGHHHKRQRKLLNPVFSAAHMKGLAPMFYDVSHQLCKTLMKKAKNGPIELDALFWIHRAALELIARGGFGYTFDTLIDDLPTHPYTKSVAGLLPLLSQSMLLRNLLVPHIPKLGPPRFRRFLVDLIPWGVPRTMRDIIDVLHNTSLEIVEVKKKALEAGDAGVAAQMNEGKDIMSILMKENMLANEEDRLDDEELLGQINSLTLAATDTTSAVLSRMFYLLASNPEKQDRLREEVTEARKDGDLDFDKLMALPYLDAVCRETLRLYPPVTYLQRTTTQDVVLPLANPVTTTDGVQMDQIPIPKGTDVWVSVIGSNCNAKTWGPDSYEWKPERWLEPLPEALINAKISGIYSHLLTFFGGGRSCIGFKFSQLEMKIVLSVLIESLKFDLSKTEIHWQMNIIAIPNVEPDGIMPSLPMKISLV